jgi:small subunit ribosomal protein S5
MVNFPEKSTQPSKAKIESGAGGMWTDHVVQIRRVTKVCKGGKKLSFRVIVVTGNKMGQVGVGVGKADGIPQAINKGVIDAKRHLISILLTKKKTITHLTIGNFCSAKTFLKPASEGTGLIAGSSTRIVLELVGIKNILSKQLGSNSLLNNAQATICALKNLKNPADVAKYRNMDLENFY